MRRRLPHERTPAPALVAAAIATLAPACSSELPPTGQVVLYLSTDAPLPAPPGIPSTPDEPGALFDRVRFDIYGPGDATPCKNCSRELSIDRALVDSGRASVGVVPRPGVRGYRARVRLFRGASERQGEPRPDTSIDVTVELPAAPEEGLVDVTVSLPTDSAGTSLGSLEEPLSAELGRPPKGKVGSWPFARRVACAGQAGPEEACIPGGAYWMGHPDQIVAPDGAAGADIQRLVALSPFFLDRTEVTVAELRASGIAELDSTGQSVDPVSWSGSRSGNLITSPKDYCTYTTTKGPNEALPVNCISNASAQAFCASRGKRLPSEAELEYAASGLSSLTYVWGDDAPGCADAVFGQVLGASGECPVSRENAGPRAPGAGLRDRLDLGAGNVVLDLAGNLSEWTLDTWNRQDEPCWGMGVFHDPICASVSRQDGSLPTIRGGSWTMVGPFLKAARRERIGTAGVISVQIGFRCARSATVE